MGHFDLSGSGEPFQSEGQREQSEEWLKKRERGPTGFCHPPFLPPTLEPQSCPRLPPGIPQAQSPRVPSSVVCGEPQSGYY